MWAETERDVSQVTTKTLNFESEKEKGYKNSEYPKTSNAQLSELDFFSP